jgi:type II secretory pathway predicted ATPase ExeA/tetratricopeptide (TPR) repeat protein
MYDSFYNVAENPFKISTDPRFLWCGEKHTQILSDLIYGLMDSTGIVVFTGDIGTGKTTLVNALLKILGSDVYVAIINHPSLSATEFLTLVAKNLDSNFTGTNKSDLLLFLDTFFNRAHAEGKTILLIIDEAQHLPSELLDELRLLSNREKAGQKILSTMLVGQTELKSMIEAPGNRSLHQRVTLFCEIKALSENETPLYVGYRLKVSGARDQLFTPRAMQTIHAFSKGNPRLINVLCDRAMRIGFMKRHKKIDADIIIECARDLKIGNRVKVRVLELLGPEILAWRNEIPTRMEKWWAAAKPRLQKARTWILKQGKALFPQIRSLCRGVAEKLTAAYGRLNKKQFPKAHPALWMAGIGLLALLLIINMQATHGKKDNDAAAVNQDAPVQRTTPSNLGNPQLADSGMTLENSTVLASASPSALRRDAMPVHQETETARQPQPATPDPVLAPDTEEPQTTLRQAAASALERENYQKAIELFESSLRAGVEMDNGSAGLYSDALLGRALNIVETSPSEAETLLLKAIKVSPDNARAYLALGKYRTRARAYAQAVEAYRKAIRLDPNLSDALFNLGYIYATTGRLEDAESAFSSTIQLKPPYMAKSLFNLAVVQQKLGKKEQSLANLEKAVAMMPQNKKALAYLNRLKHSASGGSGERNH